MIRLNPGVTLSPRDYDVVLFDLKGVLTKGKGTDSGAETAVDIGEPLVPFDIDADYRRSAYFVPTATGSDSENPAGRLLPLLRYYLRLVARVITLLNSRSHSAELAAATQRSQSPKLKFTVEKACCRKGI
jgi:hypothetical protein